MPTMPHPLGCFIITFSDQHKHNKYRVLNKAYLLRVLAKHARQIAVSHLPRPTDPPEHEEKRHCLIAAKPDIGQGIGSLQVLRTYP